MTARSLLRGLVPAVATLLFLVCLLAILVTGPVVVRQEKMDLSVSASPERLRRDVERLCGDLSPRSADHVENLERAARWIEREFRATGLDVETQEYQVGGRIYRNVIAVRPGTEATDRVLVLGAHYDAFGTFPGADDNASGVAVLLETARTLPHPASKHTQFFVAFATEEPPQFGTDDMGSYRFARRLRERGLRVEVMVSLDLVGRFSDEPGSQRFPLPGLGLFYPDRGNFIAVVGDLRSGSAIKRVRSAMLATGALPVRSFRAPAALAGVHWSDHISFRRLDMPAVMVTDTAFLRHDDYHTERDTPDALDYDRMAALVRALHGVIL